MIDKGAKYVSLDFYNSLTYDRENGTLTLAQSAWLA